MTRRTQLTISIAAVCLFLISCGKSNSKPNTQPNNSTGNTTGGTTLNINVALMFYGPQTELIVSEPGGKILLDTIANNTGASVVASLKTTDTLVDATEIMPEQGSSNISVFTFKSVNLARITAITTNAYGNIYKRPTPSIESHIVYYKIPSQINLLNNIFFANYAYNGLESMQGAPNNEVDVTYDNFPGNYAYFLLPQSGLYNLHMQQNNIDTIDCSHLDTAVRLTFNRPVPFTPWQTGNELFGVLDTTDLSKVIGFTDYGQPYSVPGVDFEYAPIPVQKYEMTYNATLANNDNVSFYAYTKTLPQALPRPLGNDFSISSTQADNFSVTFPNTKPSSYDLNLRADSTIGYTIVIPPDSATVHPITFLTNLKSKFLANARVSSLKLEEFALSDYNGMNYLNYCDFITDAAASQAHPPTSVSILSRDYY